MIPVPHDEPYCVHKNDFKKHFWDLFQFPWNDAIIFLRFHSSVAWWKPAASPCISQCHKIPSHFKSSVFHYPLCVSLYHIPLFSQTFVYFSWSAWKGVIFSLCIPCIFFLYPRQLLPSLPQSVSPPLCLNPLRTAVVAAISPPPPAIIFLLSHITAPYCPPLPVPPSFFLCFSLAVWICPSPNRLSHLNDGCLRLSWQPRSDSAMVLNSIFLVNSRGCLKCFLLCD